MDARLMNPIAINKQYGDSLIQEEPAGVGQLVEDAGSSQGVMSPERQPAGLVEPSSPVTDTADPYAQEVLEAGGQLVDEQPSEQEPLPQPATDTADPYAQEVLAAGGQLVDEQPTEQAPEYSWTDRGAQFAAGFAGFPATASDFVARTAGAGSAFVMQKAFEGLGLERAAKEQEELKKIYGQSDLRGKQQEWMNEKYGKDITPKDWKGDWLNLSGEVSFPVGLPFKIAAGLVKIGSSPTLIAKGIETAFSNPQVMSVMGKGAVTTANKALKEISGNLLGSAMLEGVEHENPYLNFANKIMAFAFGKKIGGGIYGKTTSKIGQKLGVVAKPPATPEDVIKDVHGLSRWENRKAKALGAFIDATDELQAVHQKAGAHGVQLPAAAYFDPNGMVNWVINNKVASFLASPYKKIIQKFADQIAYNIRQIEEIPAAWSNKRTTANVTKEFLLAEDAAISKQGKAMYDYAASTIPEGASIPVSNLISSMKKIQQELSKRTLFRPEHKIVYKALADIGEKFSLFPEELIGELRISGEKEFVLGNKAMDQLKNTLFKETKNPTIPVEKLFYLRSDLKPITEYGQTHDFRSLLSGTIDAINKDLLASPYVKTKELWDGADKFWRVNKIERLRSFLAENAKGDKSPEAFMQSLKTVTDLELLDFVLGKSPKGQEILNVVKRNLLTAKITKVLKTNPDVIHGNNINFNALAANFTNPEAAEMTEMLIGKKAFNDLKDFQAMHSKLAAAGKAIGINLSRTAAVSSDLNMVHQAVVEAWQTVQNASIGAVSGAGTGHAISGGIVGVIAAPMLTRSFFKTIADKRLMDAAYNYSLLRLKQVGGQVVSSSVAKRATLKVKKSMAQLGEAMLKDLSSPEGIKAATIDTMTKERNEKLKK